MSDDRPKQFAGNQGPPGGFVRPTAIGAPSRKPWRVLVADDERSTVRLIKTTLESGGCEVVVAYDGKECLEKLHEAMPDLVILDVMMPYMDGFEVLKAIRRSPLTFNLPVIMLTARAQDKEVFEGYHFGADMCLTKPINPKELLCFLRP